MIPIEHKGLKSPMKIGAKENVGSYSKMLTNGEEQLLITRDCKLYLTVGDGTYREFSPLNSGLTETEINLLINNLNITLNNKITSTNQSVTDLAGDIAIKLLKYVTKDEIEESSHKHLNKELLDLFSTNIDGELLYNGKPIDTEFDSSNLVKQNEFNSFKTETNDSILILDNKIDNINKEILELKEITTSATEDSLDDFSEHSTLPSFSSNPTISRIS